MNTHTFGCHTTTTTTTTTIIWVQNPNLRVGRGVPNEYRVFRVTERCAAGLKRDVMYGKPSLLRVRGGVSKGNLAAIPEWAAAVRDNATMNNSDNTRDVARRVQQRYLINYKTPNMKLSE